MFCCGRCPEAEKLLPVVELETPMPPVFSAGEVHDSGIEREQQIEAAAIQRQFLDLLLADEAGDVLRGRVHQRGVAGDLDLLG